MRSWFFRAVAAILATLIVVVAVLVWVHDLSFPPDRDDYLAVVGVLLFAPTFAVYAVLGERAAYRFLLPGLALLNLPQVLVEAFVSKHVVVPAPEGEGIPESVEGDGHDRMMLDEPSDLHRP